MDLRTNSVRNGVTGVARFEDEDGGIGVFGKTGGKSEACGASADDHEIIRVLNLAVVDDIPSAKVATILIMVDVAMTASECGGVFGKRNGQ